MIPRMLAGLVLLIPVSAWADDLLVAPGEPVVSAEGPFIGPDHGPVHGPYGPYWGARHWIYDYMPAHDPAYDRYGVGALTRDRRDDGYAKHFKYYEGRSQLEPALPYSEYLRYLRER